ncbi:MAG: FHA domain-containing protein [Rhodocyclaceae bacterium]
MAKIVLSLDGKIVDQRFLDSARIVVGRDGDNDIVVPADEVSPRHAMISTMVLDHFVESLDAGQPVLVNGKPATRHLLQNGDVIFLGAYRLKYLNTTAAAAGLDRTQLLKPEIINEIAAAVPDAPIKLDGACAAAHAARERLARGRVSGVWGRYAGREVEIERVLLPVGTRGECLAVINRRPTGCFLTHVSGRQRAKVNGMTVGAEPVQLKDGDTIEADTDQLVFRAD